MPSYNVMTKIHVWLGLTEKSKNEFGRYFEIDESNKVTGVGASQFDKDLDIEWYDDDLIGSYYNEENDSLEQALSELPISSLTVERVRRTCLEMTINKANAMFYYEDAELIVIDENRKYNTLTYIGIFDNL